MEKFDSIFWNVLGGTNIPPKKSWYYGRQRFYRFDGTKKEAKECHFGIKKEK